MGSRRWAVGFALWVAAPAHAGDFETWWGGHVGTGLQLQQGTGLGTVLSQVEVDFRGGTGDWFFRVDLDYHVDPFFFSGDNPDYTLAPHYPLPPEYAVVQWAPGKFHLRAGVTNPDFGLQEWDERDNYLPTYTSGWNLANGQNLGIEPGITYDDGTDLFAFAGYDLAWLTPSFGFGVQTEQDLFGTWTGAFYMPWFDFGLIIAANEWYPLDALWLSLELTGGYVGPDVVGGGQLVANLFPDASFGGAVRGEIFHFTDAAAEHTEVDVDQFMVSGAFRADPTDWLHLALEAKESWPRNGGDPYFTGTLYVAVGTPGEAYEDYVVREEE